MAMFGGALPFPLFFLLGYLVFLAGRGSGCTSHSLRYFYTGVSEPGQKVPQFFLVGYVDNQPFVHYNASTRRYLPTVPWVRKVEKYDPQYWERNSQRVQKSELGFQTSLVNVAKYYNQSGGAHTLQWMYGCELRRDGRKGGYFQFAYDGRDYISFDKETRTWTAADVPAQITKRKWEAEPALAVRRKAYLEEECIEWLQRHLEYGKETLLRLEKPEVKVTRKVEYDGMETLICRVGGFYPKEIDITWTKDGEVWMEDTYHGLVSPNSDGTYYTWWSVTVDPEERERYKCHVDHDGLLKPVDVTWKEPEVPEVKVTHKVEYDGMETLICHVGGFYPKEIDIDWTRDGEVWMQDTYHGLVSPNADGTYYTWRSITVDPEEKERYKCHVEHDGLLEPVDVAWEEPVSPSTYNLWMIIACIVMGVLVVLAVGIAVYFRSALMHSKWILAYFPWKKHTGSAVPT